MKVELVIVVVVLTFLSSAAVLMVQSAEEQICKPPVGTGDSGISSDLSLLESSVQSLRSDVEATHARMNYAHTRVNSGTLTQSQKNELQNELTIVRRETETESNRLADLQSRLAGIATGVDAANLTRDSTANSRARVGLLNSDLALIRNRLDEIVSLSTRDYYRL